MVTDKLGTDSALDGAAQSANTGGGGSPALTARVGENLVRVLDNNTVVISNNTIQISPTSQRQTFDIRRTDTGYTCGVSYDIRNAQIGDILSVQTSTW